jgi:chaperone required for assembly of F1-ATPase
LHAPQERFRRLSPPGDQTERRRRFYAEVDTESVNGGFSVRLDGRTPRSPDGAALVLPTEALAEAVAAEWAAQTGEVDLNTMPLTRLAWGALSLDEEHRAVAAEQITAFAGSDLLCYFADGPAGLVDREQRRWGPVIEWAEAALDVRFHRTQGIVHQPQPPETLARIGELARAAPDFALIGLAAAAGLFGSAILAFALRHGELTAEAAFELSRLDETFQEERWGVDAEAAARADAMAKEAIALGQWFEAL